MSLRKAPDGDSLFNHQHIINMKLHLPSGLLAAISACLIGTGSAHALIVWDSTDTATFNTDQDYSIGHLSYVASTGIITGGDTSDFTFVLNNTALSGNTSDKVNVIYVTDSQSHKWGFNATNDDLIGNWNGSDWTSTDTTKLSLSNITQETLATYADSDGKITLKATIDTTGTYLYAPATDGGNDVALYRASGLMSSTGTGGLTLTANKDFIDSVTIGYTVDNGGTSNVTVANASGNWSQQYATVARVSNGTVSYGGNSVNATLATTGRLEVTGGASGTSTDVSSHGGDLVVGGAGQLFLQTYGTGAIELDNDIILGSSSHGENSSRGALRFGNDGGTITLNGNITLVENSTMGGEDNANAQNVAINGTVSGSHDLSIVKGHKIHFNGAINNIHSLTISGGSEVTINNSVTTTGGLTVKGGTDDNASTVTINGNMTIGGNLTGGYNGTGQGSQKNIINIGAGTHSIQNLDASNNHHFAGKFHILDRANATVTNKIWLGRDAEITVAQGGSLAKGKIAISGKEAAANASITNSGADEYTLDKTGFTISHAAVTLTTNDAAATELKNKLTDVALTHAGTGTLNVWGGDGTSGNANTLTAITTGSALNILNATEAAIASVTLNDNASVGIYTGNAASGDMGTLTATSLTAGNSASVAGSLTLNGGDNALLSLGSALAIQGALNLDTTNGLIGLDGEALSGLSSGRINLFEGVTGFSVGGTAYSGEIDASTVFSGAMFNTQLLRNTAGGDTPAYVIGYEGGTVYLKATENVPEPATATLSLLALAGLAARRRRK